MRDELVERPVGDVVDPFARLGVAESGDLLIGVDCGAEMQIRDAVHPKDAVVGSRADITETYRCVCSALREEAFSESRLVNE